MLHKTSTSDCNPDESVQNMTSFMTYLQLHLVSANTYDVKNDVIVQPSYATTDLAQIQNHTESCTVTYSAVVIPFPNSLTKSTMHSVNNTDDECHHTAV